MIHIPTIALSAGLATALLVQGSVSAQAAPDGRKFKMVAAPVVLGTVRHAPRHHAGGIGLSARPRTQAIGMLLPAVQNLRDSGRGGGGGGGGGSKPKGPEDCMSCAN